MAEVENKLESFISVADLFNYMREKDLVITDRSRAEESDLKSRVLQKKWLGVNHILKSNLWDLKSREGILNVIKKLPVNERRINQKGKMPFYEVSQKAARTEAEIRGTIQKIN